jgi:hypothetical protein
MIIGFLTNVFENTLTAETFSTKHKISLTEVSKCYLHSRNKSSGVKVTKILDYLLIILLAIAYIFKLLLHLALKFI